MKRLFGVFVAGLVIAGPAGAQIPFFNATCPTNIEVHADQGGPIYVNGHGTKLITKQSSYYEARWDGSHNHVTNSVSINPDGTPDVSYTRDNGNHGICKVSEG
jgi:hypothetical protein